MRDFLGTGRSAGRRDHADAIVSTQTVNDDRSPLAFANGQCILIARTAYDAAGGHESVRDRFVEDIGIAERVKALGMPIRIALARGIISCRMYASFGQVVRGWSRIFYDALGRNPRRLAVKLLDPLVFCQTGHFALVVSVVLLAQKAAGRFRPDTPFFDPGASLLHVPCVSPHLPGSSAPLSLGTLVSARQCCDRHDPDSRTSDVHDREGDMARHRLSKLGCSTRHSTVGRFAAWIEADLAVSAGAATLIC